MTDDYHYGRVIPKDRADEVARMLEDMQAKVKAEREEREALRQYMLAMDLRAQSMTTGPTLAEELAIDDTRFAREEQVVRDRDAERAAELDRAREAADDARRAFGETFGIGDIR